MRSSCMLLRPLRSALRILIGTCSIMHTLPSPRELSSGISLSEDEQRCSCQREEWCLCFLQPSTHIYPHTCLSRAKWISQGHLANWLTCVLYITLKYIWITIKKTFAIAKETYYLWLFWLITSTFELIGSPKFKASHHLKRETSHKVSVGTMCFHLPRRRPLAVLLLRFLHAASSYAFTIQFPSLNEPFRLAAWVLTLNS